MREREDVAISKSDEFGALLGAMTFLTTHARRERGEREGVS